MTKRIFIFLIFFHITFIIFIMNNLYSVIQKDKIYYIPLIYILLNISIFYVSYIKNNLFKKIALMLIFVISAYFSIQNKNYSLLFLLNIFVTYSLYKLYFNLIKFNQSLFKKGNILLSIIIMFINICIIINYMLIDLRYPRSFNNGVFDLSILTGIWCYIITILGLFIMLIIYKYFVKKLKNIIYILCISIYVMIFTFNSINYTMFDKFTFLQEKICYYVDSDVNCRYNSYYLETNNSNTKYVFTNEKETISLVIYRDINNIDVFNYLITDLYIPTSVFHYKLLVDNREINLKVDFNIKYVKVTSDNVFVIGFDNKMFVIDKEGNIELLD